MLLFAFPLVKAQSFSDDFESYNVSDYLANSSSTWITWNNAPGTSEDAQITNKDAASGNNSIYFESQFGGGPQDVVLPFGGVHSSGKFKFTSKWKIASKTGAYFNFQGDASLGSTWALDVYMYDDGTIDVGGYLSGTYPQDQWFELSCELDLTNNKWEFFIDGVSLGYFSNSTNRVSYIDIYTLFTSDFYLDDVSFCKDYACFPDISLDKLVVDPNPLCSNHESDVTIYLTNNGPQTAPDMVLGIDMAGQGRVTKKLILNDLAVGKDTSITIPGMFKTNMIGTGLSISAVNATRDQNELNDTVYTTIDVLPSPSGFDMVKGTTFQGKLRLGSGIEPDLIEVGKTNSYELVPGAGFTNANYSSAWTISSVLAFTSSNVLVPSTDYSTSLPSSGVNGTLRFTGAAKYLDSVITFSVTVENGSNGCDSVVTRSIRIVPTPKVSFTIPSSICLGDDVAFTNTSSIHSGNNVYMWYFGDGDSSDADNSYHIYTLAGSYNVKLVATSYPWGIVKDTIIKIIVSDIPAVKFRANNKCQGIAVDFVNQSTVPSGVMAYDWDFGDGTAHSTIKDPSHLYSAAGGYRVTLKAKANGCEASIVKNAYMFARPIADFTAPSTPVCAKTEVRLPNKTVLTSGKQGALWSFGDGGSSTILEGVHTYQTAGTYSVKLLAVSEFECRDSITKPVTIKATPTPVFSGNQFCGKIPTVFTNKTVEAVPNPVYTWTFSDNYTSNLKNVTRTWPFEGPFSATLKADYSNGCSGSTTQDFRVFIQPKADFTLQDVCSGEKAVFVNKSKGDRSGMEFNWDFGNSATSTEMAPTYLYNPAKTTTYTVTLVVAYPAACSDTIRKSITVSEAPVCDFTYKELGFLNIKFNPSNTTYSKYEWIFGEGGTSTASSPSYLYNYKGNFNVTMRATNSAGCVCEITKKVSANTAVNSVNTVSGLIIYPNPNNGTFTVKSAESQDIKVEVFTVLGSKVYSRTSDTGNLLVNLEDQAKGIYLVKITVNGVTTTSKITVN